MCIKSSLSLVLDESRRSSSAQIPTCYNCVIKGLHEYFIRVETCFFVIIAARCLFFVHTRERERERKRKKESLTPVGARKTEQRGRYKRSPWGQGPGRDKARRGCYAQRPSGASLPGTPRGPRVGPIARGSPVGLPRRRPTGGRARGVGLDPGRGLVLGLAVGRLGDMEARGGTRAVP